MSRSKILYYIGTIVLGVIGSFVYDGVRHLPLLSGLKAFASWLWSDILRFKLELWVIVISFLIIYLRPPIRGMRSSLSTSERPQTSRSRSIATSVIGTVYSFLSKSVF